MEKALKEKDKIQVAKFGSFEVKTRTKHTGHSPRSNEEVVIPASKASAVKAGRSLKDAVNESFKEQSKAKPKKEETTSLLSYSFFFTC